MLPLAVLADANVLVKDVVSFVFYDLAQAGVIDLRWTPHIEAEYVKHRARLRAKAHDRSVSVQDFVWAAKRLKPIKKHLVPNFLPPGWDTHGDWLDPLRLDPALAPLLQLPDAKDVHVALAAADWARQKHQNVLLATENLKDFPAKVLEPFRVIPLHPGDVLELAYLADPKAVPASLHKTAEDFKDPAFTLQDMLRSVASAQQFCNPGLATKLAKRWTRC